MAVNHVNRTLHGHIAPCSGVITEKWVTRCAVLKAKHSANKPDRTRAKEEVMLQTDEKGFGITAAIEQRNSNCWGGGGISSNDTSQHDAIDLINSLIRNSVAVSDSVSRLSSGTAKKPKTWQHD